MAKQVSLQAVVGMEEIEAQSPTVMMEGAAANLQPAQLEPGAKRVQLGRLKRVVGDQGRALREVQELRVLQAAAVGVVEAPR